MKRMRCLFPLFLSFVSCVGRHQTGYSHTLPIERVAGAPDSTNFTFSPLWYLRSKESFDNAHRCPRTFGAFTSLIRRCGLNRLRSDRLRSGRLRSDGHRPGGTDTEPKNSEGSYRKASGGKPYINVADIGCGVLSFLRVLLPAVLDLEEEGVSVTYTGYDINLSELVIGARETLHSLNFTRAEDESSIYGIDEVWRRGNVTVILRGCDFRLSKEASADSVDSVDSADFVIGGCFADLFSDVSELMRCFGRMGAEGSDLWVYLPGTYDGYTGWEGGGDEEYFNDYNCGLVQLNQSVSCLSDLRELSPEILHEGTSMYSRYNGTIGRMGRIGTMRVVDGDGGVVDDDGEKYLRRCFLGFFDGVVGRKGGGGAEERARGRGVVVGEFDWLGKIRAGAAGDDTSEGDGQRDDDEGDSQTEMEGKEIVFTSPRALTVSKFRLPPLSDFPLGKDEVIFRPIHSLVSSGTELGIFRGEFLEGEERGAKIKIDETIEGMEGGFGFPMKYGYCCVGRVTSCHPSVSDVYLGKLFFSFSPHSSLHRTSVSSLLALPDDIPVELGIFLPSVETAVGLVHDCNVILGEKVAVVGAGLIGMIVLEVLGKCCGLLDVGVYELSNARRERALKLSDNVCAGAIGSDGKILEKGIYDKSIEVTGRMEGVQVAIDCVGNGGTVVLGSWLRRKGELSLGLDFHRSHKHLIASQVSHIPAPLSSRWSKSRRFALTWKVLRELNLRHTVNHRVNIDDEQAVQEAYDRLDRGEDLVVRIDYPMNH